MENKYLGLWQLEVQEKIVGEKGVKHWEKSKELHDKWCLDNSNPKSWYQGRKVGLAEHNTFFLSPMRLWAWRKSAFRGFCQTRKLDQAPTI